MGLEDVPEIGMTYKHPTHYDVCVPLTMSESTEREFVETASKSVAVEECTWRVGVPMGLIS